MSDRYPGGIITKTPVVPAGPYEDGAAPGIWTLEQQAYYQAQGLWPIAGNLSYDPYYKYVTMLLTGDGTNGAQNNTFLDSSSNAYTVTRNGNTTQGSFSPYGSLWSNYFDGASDYLTVPNNAALNFGSGNFTIEFWINLPSDVGSGPVVAMGQSGGSNSQFSVFCNGSDLYFYAATDSSSWTGYTADAITYNTWQHWAFVKSSGTLYVYRNGTLASSASLGTLNNDTTHALTIATQYTSGGVLPNTSQDIKGYISNLRIVKGTAVYTSAFTPSTTPLTAISGTSLLTCQSNRFIDNSSNAFAITVNGTPSVQRFSPFNPTESYSTATIGGSGYFDGSGDYLKTSSSVGIANSAFSICLWFYPLDSSVIGLFDSGPNQLNCFRNYSANVIEDQNTTGSVNFETYYQVKAWNWMCVTKSGTSFTVYINGTTVGTGTCSNALTESNFTVGAINNGGDGSYNGYLSDFQVLNSATNVSAPTSPIQNASGKTYLLNFQNAGIPDYAMMNDLETVGNAQISTSVKKFGTGSISFDGTGDYLLSPDTQASYFGTGNFTLECWLKTSSTSSYKTVLCPATVYSTSGFYNFIVRSDNTIAFEQGSGSTLVQSTTQVTDGNWHHVAVCRSGTTTRVFVDGVLEGTLNSDTYSYGVNSVGFYVGTYAPSTYNFNGYIDDLRITNGYARYTANFTPPTTAFYTY